MSTAAVAHSARAGWRAPVSWGPVVGVALAATPLPFWWLDTAPVYALGLAAIAAVYIGFAVADGRSTGSATAGSFSDASYAGNGVHGD